MNPGKLLVGLLALLLSLPSWADSHADQPQAASKTKIVLLGTGMPMPDPNRKGQALAIVVNGTAYLVDFGPGLVRQASAAFGMGHKELEVSKLGIGFLTHLHSDHTVGLPDLLLSSWTLGRTAPFELYGPVGTKAMVEHIHEAWTEDIVIRTEGYQKTNKTGHYTNVTEIAPGVIYQDQNIKVTAIPVPHGDWKHAFGFRFDTPDRSIVISGDTAPSEALMAACNPCDVLIHEVYVRALAEQEDGTIDGIKWKEYFGTFHTSTDELGEMAAKVKPGLLLLTHHMLLGLATDEEMVAEIRDHYKGPLEIGVDLGVY